MKIVFIILIILFGILLMGPIMLLFSKLNKIDPYVLEKENKDETSYLIVNILRPLFFPLWIETKFVKWIKSIRK